MADYALVSAAAIPAGTNTPRHTAIVRATHWITALCFVALLVSGIEIVISHPRFYWGETGNVLTPALFELPIPASRPSVPTGYGFVLPDQNGWSRYLHFQAAWVVGLTGLLYALYGLLTRHFGRNLLPTADSISWRDILFPLVIWTGLAMSPAIAAAFPPAVTAFGGQQSARTIHFFVSVFLLLFLLVHIVMVCRAGFRNRMRAMITGRAGAHKEHA